MLQVYIYILNVLSNFRSDTKCVFCRVAGKILVFHDDCACFTLTFSAFKRASFARAWALFS